jgi:hypothetical protein
MPIIIGGYKHDYYSFQFYCQELLTRGYVISLWMFADLSDIYGKKPYFGDTIKWLQSFSSEPLSFLVLLQTNTKGRKINMNYT